MIKNTEIDSEQSTLWDNIRSKRALLLKDADNSVNKAIDNEEDESAFRKYRQELRDVTNSEDPSNITWPTKP